MKRIKFSGSPTQEITERYVTGGSVVEVVSGNGEFIASLLIIKAPHAPKDGKKKKKKGKEPKNSKARREMFTDLDVEDVEVSEDALGEDGKVKTDVSQKKIYF